MPEDFDTVVNALARMRGVSPEEIKREMLEKAMGLGASSPPAPSRAEHRPLARRASTGDASGVSLAQSRAEALERHAAEEFPGSPVVRYRDEEESPVEARERWLEEEAELRDGVHGMGGSTAGGIFGEGPIATNIYDPSSHARGDSRENHQVNAKILGVLDRLVERLDGAGAAPQQLPGAPRRTLTGAPRGRLGIGKK
jgi:hypothetical protein